MFSYKIHTDQLLVCVGRPFAPAPRGLEIWCLLGHEPQQALSLFGWYTFIFSINFSPNQFDPLAIVKLFHSLVWARPSSAHAQDMNSCCMPFTLWPVQKPHSDGLNWMGWSAQPAVRRHKWGHRHQSVVLELAARTGLASGWAGAASQPALAS